MPQEQSQYKHAYNARKKTGQIGQIGQVETPLPASDGKTINPAYLLNHENHFDKSTYSPEQLIQKGILKPGGMQQDSKS